MILTAFLGLIALSIFMLLSLNYKRKERKKFYKKKHQFLPTHGLAMFITDRIPKSILRNNQKLNLAMRELIVSEDIDKDRYFYVVGKIAVCIVAMWITLFLALGIGVSERMERKEISAVSRDNKKDKEYHLQIKDEKGKEEQVTISVAKKQYTEKQIKAIFDKRKKELINKVLGDNQSQDRVNKNINLITTIGEENISVTWNISDKSKVDYNGNLSKKIAEEGELVTFTATMQLGKITEDYIFALNVFPPEQKGGMGEKLQEYVDENSRYDEKIRLPAQINGQTVKYQNITSESSGYILLIGVFISIALFFLKDTDLKKEVSKRNQQLLNDYPEIVSKILLYYGTGLSIQQTIERIVRGYEEEKNDSKKLYRYAYEELNMCLIKMKSGVSEMVALNRYGERCRLHCYRKLTSLLEQNVRRGTKDIALALKSELNEAMNEKKNNMLRKGGQISTKLIAPMILMLILTMVIIMVPAFMSMEY